MSESSPIHTSAPSNIPALLAYLDELDERRSYMLRHAGELGWQLAEVSLDAPYGMGLRVHSLGPIVPAALVLVDAGADLRRAELGAITTVTAIPTRP